MNKKTKKKIEMLRTRLQKLQQILASVKKQSDDPTEVTQVEQEIKKVRDELSALTQVKA